MKLTDRQKIRILEIIPGALVWTTLIAAVILSFVRPLWVIYFIVVFDVYWLIRIAYFAIFLITSWRIYRRNIKIDWEKKLNECPDAAKLYHLVFLPTSTESYEVLKTTMEALAASAFSKTRMLVVLAGEERFKEMFLPKAERLLKEYDGVFKKIFVTLHTVKPGELVGKSANLSSAAREVRPQLAAMGISDESIIVSSFDSDTVVHPQYFAHLTYTYCRTPDPLHSSYQPMVVYNNNIWDAPAALRVAAFGTTFWLMTELARPEFMATFSSHSMPWKMLVDVGYWQTDIVSEDSRIFLQAFVHYNGNYRVTPLYIPVSMDTVGGKNYWGYLKGLYKQQRRWAWGVENFPYLAWEMRKKARPNFPKGKKWFMIFRTLEGMYSWATAPILMFVLGRLPLYLTQGSDREVAFVQNTPFTLEYVMTIAMIGTIIAMTLATRMLPPRPQTKKRWNWLVMILQWALTPVTFIVFGSIPATDAQTRLLFGGRFRLGFNISDKAKRAAETEVFTEPKK
jgi:Glycosyl transferase family group 2